MPSPGTPFTRKHCRPIGNPPHDMTGRLLHPVAAVLAYAFPSLSHRGNDDRHAARSMARRAVRTMKETGAPPRGAAPWVGPFLTAEFWRGLQDPAAAVPVADPWFPAAMTVDVVARMADPHDTRKTTLAVGMIYAGNQAETAYAMAELGAAATMVGMQAGAEVSRCLAIAVEPNNAQTIRAIQHDPAACCCEWNLAANVANQAMKERNR